jgi:DNA-binding PucR family transcriptional regulator
VIEYDEAHNSELVRSLAEYLERGGSLDQAAESLFIHRSTLKYRLGRVANLAGVDLTDPDTRFNLQLATRVLATVVALASVSSR